MSNEHHLPSARLIELSSILLSTNDWTDSKLFLARNEVVELLAPLMDHTILKPEATAAELLLHCEQSRRYHFASVCVHSYWVPYVKEWLTGSNRKICCVIGFPSGMISYELKCNEIEWCIAAGADEIDIVWTIGAVQTGDWDYIENEIQALIRVSKDIPVKIILETSMLSDNQTRKGCELCANSGVAFVKTSTGFHPSGGASIETVKLMRSVVGNRCGVKASGGIRDLRSALKMIQAGANRIGTSNGVTILETYH